MTTCEYTARTGRGHTLVDGCTRDAVYGSPFCAKHRDIIERRGARIAQQDALHRARMQRDRFAPDTVVRHRLAKLQGKVTDPAGCGVEPIPGDHVWVLFEGAKGILPIPSEDLERIP